MGYRFSKTELSVAKACGEDRHAYVYVNNHSTMATDGRFMIEVEATEQRQLGGEIQLEPKELLKVAGKCKQTAKARAAGQHQAVLDFYGHECSASVEDGDQLLTYAIDARDCYRPDSEMLFREAEGRVPGDDCVEVSLNIEKLRILCDVLFAEPTKDQKIVTLRIPTVGKKSEVLEPILVTTNKGEAAGRVRALLAVARGGGS